VVRDGVVLAHRQQGAGRGSSAVLPAMARQVLDEAGVAAQALSGIAVTVGPGSFTGVRAALALAHGMALGAGVPVWGVTVGAALRAQLRGVRPLWAAVDNKRGRVFLDDGMGAAAVGLDALPAPDGPVAIAGDAAIAVVSRLAARGFDVQLLLVGGPSPVGIAGAARAAALPLYVDPVEARPGPAGRPAPLHPMPP
jgi:tRNA A37 threonylcarbamoyladenosine modification protein TsaB